MKSQREERWHSKSQFRHINHGKGISKTWDMRIRKFGQILEIRNVEKEINKDWDWVRKKDGRHKQFDVW